MKSLALFGLVINVSLWATCMSNENPRAVTTTCSCTGNSFGTNQCANNGNYNDGCDSIATMTQCGTTGDQPCYVISGTKCTPDHSCANHGLPEQFDLKLPVTVAYLSGSSCSFSQPFDAWLRKQSDMLVEARLQAVVPARRNSKPKAENK